jgi:predicted RNase H-like HicB family nuclease
MRAHEEYNFTVLYEPAEEGGYVMKCPALPGLVTEGDTLEEARAMAEDAIRGYLESLRKDGLRVPEDIKLALQPIKRRLIPHSIPQIPRPPDLEC